MRRVSILITIVLAVCLAINIGSLPLTGNQAEGEFEVLKDGSVKAGPHVFKKMSDYFLSDYFRETGKRCGTRVPEFQAESNREFSIQGDASDCTLSITVLRSEYWPAEPLTIPVVFHIIMTRDGLGDIPDQRIIDQVAVLNEDFRAIADTLGELGFDTKIQFELAGITRTVNDNWFKDKNDIQYKSELGWDQDYYCNIYTNSGHGYIGYSYYPQDRAGDVKDGIVLMWDVVGGRDNGLHYPYDQGRTLIHEMGHYLGLHHTFYEGDTCCNGYDCGDRILDTETEAYAHDTCIQEYTCGTPDPITNYMDYPEDLCYTHFTMEQGNRMVCSLVHYRPDLYY